ERVESRRGARKLPEPLAIPRVNKLLSTPDCRRPKELRDRALFELMYSSGLRVSEVVGLQLTDLDLERGLLRCVGKGSKERIVPVGKVALELVSRYLADRAR